MIPLIVMVGIIGLIALIVIVPGHTPTEGATSGSGSSGGTITPDGEMILITPEEANPVVTDLKNGSYQVTGLMRSYADSDYINVEILVEGYDANGTEITEKKGVIAKIKVNETSQYTVILTPKKGEFVASAEGIVLNATAV